MMKNMQQSLGRTSLTTSHQPLGMVLYGYQDLPAANNCSSYCTGEANEGNEGSGDSHPDCDQR